MFSYENLASLLTVYLFLLLYVSKIFEPIDQPLPVGILTMLFIIGFLILIFVLPELNNWNDKIEK